MKASFAAALVISLASSSAQADDAKEIRLLRDQSNAAIAAHDPAGVVNVSSYNDLAAERGNWVGRWTAPEGPVEVGGTYFAQWRKVGADWKIRAEVFVGLYCDGAGC